MVADVEQVSLGTRRKVESSHGLPLLLGQLELLPDTGEHVALSHAAGIAFVNRSTQGGQLRLVPFFVPFQSSKRGTDHFAGVFIPAGFDFGKYKTIQLIR
jgi:hypothetical protein